MSSPNHPTSDIEDAFSSNFHDYFPATSGNKSPNSLDDFTKYLLATLVFSPLLQTIIALPTALPSSSVSPMLDSRDFFPLDEISPKDTKTSETPTQVTPSSSIGSSSPVRMPPKRISTSEAPAMTQATIKKLVVDSVYAALKAQAVNMANTDNTTGLKETLVSRKCTYNNYIEDCKVKFATGTLTEDVLSWWKSYAKPIGIKQADKITWTELKRLLTNKYCPRTEVKKMEDEFYDLIIKENDLKTYIRRFKELAVYAQIWYQTPKNLWKVSSGDCLKALKETMPPKRISASEAPAMTQATIKKLVVDSVYAALKAQAVYMANTDNTTGLKETPVSRKCTYK
uniref:Reverse transcriptase domain-containing protein n=1 Tax=Tanacetum cinerariifolium TaxID=118510 RepID=A0A699KE08_TANCI|nr:reverse transcriptase domain-containing protein [Tanacetum cinerariifolium]